MCQIVVLSSYNIGGNGRRYAPEGISELHLYHPLRTLMRAEKLDIPLKPLWSMTVVRHWRSLSFYHIINQFATLFLSAMRWLW